MIIYNQEETLETVKEPDENTPIYISPYEIRQPGRLGGRHAVYAQEEVMKHKLENAKQDFAYNKEHVEDNNNHIIKRTEND